MDVFLLFLTLQQPCNLGACRLHFIRVEVNIRGNQVQNRTAATWSAGRGITMQTPELRASQRTADRRNPEEGFCLGDEGRNLSAWLVVFARSRGEAPRAGARGGPGLRLVVRTWASLSNILRLFTHLQNGHTDTCSGSSRGGRRRDVRKPGAAERPQTVCARPM